MSTRPAHTKLSYLSELLRCNVFNSIGRFEAIVVPHIRCDRLPHVRPRLVLLSLPIPPVHIFTANARSSKRRDISMAAEDNNSPPQVPRNFVYAVCTTQKRVAIVFRSDGRCLLTPIGDFS